MFQITHQDCQIWASPKSPTKWPAVLRMYRTLLVVQIAALGGVLAALKGSS
jgi:hypothetical protein